MRESVIDHVVGRGVVLRGDDIDTDRIVPARFLKTVTFDALEAHVFEDDRIAASATGSPHPFDQPHARGAAVLIAGANFGCGSSREHAPQALYRWGIRAIVAESFAEIFFSNAAAIGLLCVSVSAADAHDLRRLVEQDHDVSVGVWLDDQVVTCGSRVFSASMPAHARDSFMTGTWDAAGLLVENPDDVAKIAKALPYLRGF